MRHAFLVTAYRDYATLCGLVDQLLDLPDSRIFINIDGRSKELISQFTGHLKTLNNPRIDLQAQEVDASKLELSELLKLTLASGKSSRG